MSTIPLSNRVFCGCVCVVVLMLACDDTTTYQAQTSIVDVGSDRLDGNASSGSSPTDTSPPPPDTALSTDTVPPDTATPDTATPDTAMPDTTVSADVDSPTAGTVLQVVNRGNAPAYLGPGYRGEASWRGLSLFRVDDDGERERIPLGPGCRLPCSERCSLIACEPPPQEVFQIIPGGVWSFEWDRSAVAIQGCRVDDGTEATCYEPTVAPVGLYVAQVCFSTELIPAFEALSVRRQPERDTLVPAQVGETRCVEAQFAVDDVFGTLTEIPIRPNAASEDKPFGFCGPAWTWFDQPPIILSTPDQAQQGASVPVWAGWPSEGPVQLCQEPAVTTDPTPTDQPGHFEVSLATLWSSQTCDDASGGSTYLLPPVETAEVVALQVAGLEGGPRTVQELAVCPTCFSGSGTAEWGAACQGDSDCADPQAFCDLRGAISCEPTGVCEGQCAVECRSNRDCPGNWLCEAFTDGQGARCRPQAQDACQTTSDCPQGQRCIRDGNAFARCLPDLDVRGLDSEGRGVWCGCDAECPGGQSCVRMEVDVADGFCALRCRDDRDCPDAWSCLGLTASGLSSICAPSDM